jgi:hypothetical protein
MKTENKYTIRCLAIGVVTLTLFVVVMFWVRSLFAATQGKPERASDRILVSPLPILRVDAESEPNVTPSSLDVRFNQDRIGLTMTTGIEGRGEISMVNGDVYEWDPPRKDGSEGKWLYFDRQLGLLVYRHVARVFDPNASDKLMAQWYAGPEGMARTPEASLGRFRSPIVGPVVSGWIGFVYDGASRRFFKCDWRSQRVTQGPPLDASDEHRPIQLVWLQKGDCVGMSFTDPMHAVGKKDNGDPNIVPVTYTRSWGGEDGLIPVLDASGRIDLLKGTTLTYFSRPAGYLPQIENSPGVVEISPAEGLFAYQVMPLWRWSRSPHTMMPEEYLGCAVAAISRDATKCSVQVFNEWAHVVREERGDLVGTTEAYGSTKYFLESLHPPVLLMLSEFAAPYIEAVSGAHDLFVLPNSYIAERGRTANELWVVRVAAGLGLASLSLALAVILAWLVGRDGRFFGLRKNTRTVWILVTVLFGIPACITYLLMRPRVTLVTCRNCGKLRRPDHERCHRCDSPWEVPELNAPTWRVCDTAASGVCNGNVKSEILLEQKPDSSVNRV